MSKNSILASSLCLGAATALATSAFTGSAAASDPSLFTVLALSPGDTISGLVCNPDGTVASVSVTTVFPPAAFNSSTSVPVSECAGAATTTPTTSTSTSTSTGANTTSGSSTADTATGHTGQWSTNDMVNNAATNWYFQSAGGYYSDPDEPNLFGSPSQQEAWLAQLDGLPEQERLRIIEAKFWASFLISSAQGSGIENPDLFFNNDMDATGGTLQDNEELIDMTSTTAAAANFLEENLPGDYINDFQRGQFINKDVAKLVYEYFRSADTDGSWAQAINQHFGEPVIVSDSSFISSFFPTQPTQRRAIAEGVAAAGGFEAFAQRVRRDFRTPFSDSRPRFEFGLGGGYTFNDDNRAGVQSDGGSLAVQPSLRYRLNDRLAVGATVRYRESGSDRNDGSSSIDSQAFGASIFADIAIDGNLVISPIMSFEHSHADIRVANGGATATGSFNTDIFTVGANASSEFELSNNGVDRRSFISPFGSVSYSMGNRDAYTLSDGSTVASDKLHHGAATFGATIGAEFLNVSEKIALVAPSLTAAGVWNFATEDFTSTTGSVIESPDVFGSVSAGVDVQLHSGVRASLVGTYAGLGSDIGAFSVSGQLVIPFGN